RARFLAFCVPLRRPPRATPFPYTTLFRSLMSSAMVNVAIATGFERQYQVLKRLGATPLGRPRLLAAKTTAVLAIELVQLVVLVPDRKSTRLNSSHVKISYAVFCLKKKKKK